MLGEELYHGYQEQIQSGKKIATDYIQEERSNYAKRINAFEWVQGSEDKAANVHRLIIYIGGERHSIPFSEEELADAPGTPGKDCQLKTRVDQFFKVIEESH